MAALYSEHVHALTLTDRTLLEKSLDHARAHGIPKSKDSRRTRIATAGVPISIFGGGSPVAATPEALQYLEFVQANFDDLVMLTKAKVFISHFPDAFGYGGTFRPDDNTSRTLQRWPPSYWDFGRSLPLPGEQSVASFRGYLTFLAGLAQQQRAILGTWSLDFQHQLIGAVDQLADGGPISTQPLWTKQVVRPRRHATAVALANRILDRTLPAVDDLSFHDVLELRDRCASERKSFQVSIQKLATEIDLTRSPVEIASDISDRISVNVEPALRELEAKLTSAKFSIIKSSSTKVGVTTAVTMAVSLFVSGLPSDIKTRLTTLAAGGLAAAALTVDDPIVDHRQLSREHQWSMVFQFTKLARRKIQYNQHRRDPFRVGP
jgi:hypothetical protein